MTSIRLKANSYKNIIKNKFLVEIVDSVISSYPLTYVNLERLRKEVDNFSEQFWIKDEGKYLLVNNQFASNFHLTPQQIEGKLVEKFIPAYMVNFNKALEEYIKDSGSVFIIEGFPLSGAPAGENYQVIEIPVQDSEGNLSAIIGITQETKSEEKSGSLSSSLHLFRGLLKNYILINSENTIADISEEFCKTFSVDAGDLKGKNYFSEISGIPVIISTMIDDFIKSGKKTQSAKVNIHGIPGNDFMLHFIKGKEEEKLLLVEAIGQVKDSQLSPDSDILSYDFIIQNNPEPVFIYEKENLRFLQVNDYALKLYGYRKDEFLRMDLTDLYSPEDIQTLLEGSDEKLTIPKPHRQKRKDGANIFVEFNRVQINYKNKPAFLNTVRNITENLKIEKEKQYYNAAFNNITDLIFTTDKEGFIKSISNSVKETLGYSDKNLIETSLTTLLVDEDRGKINSSVFHAGVKEKLIFETSLKKAGRESLKVKLIVNPIFDFNSEVESYYIICSSVQEQVIEIIKEVIKEIPVEIRHEVALSTVPEINFLSGIFHDLLTPINVILGFVQDLTENIEPPSPEQKEALEIINLNKQNLLALINQIMEFTQTEKGQVELKYEKIKIIDLIEELKHKIDAGKIIEDAELAFGKISSSLEVINDKDKLQQFLVLLINLIFKVTGQRKLYLSAIPVDDEHFAVCLSDNYNTVSQKFFEKITEIFSDSSINIKVQGLPSFSLKHSKNLLNLLQGEFKLSEEMNKSGIMFEFPLEPEERVSEENINSRYGDIIDSNIGSEKSPAEKEIIQKEADQIEKNETIKYPIETSKQTSVDLSQLSCLYIEDQLDSQMLFSMQMKDIKELKFAVSLEQSIPLIRNNNFDFIVIDINLQGDYNGLDILKLIRTIPDYENIPVIAITAYYLPVDKEVYIQAGFSDFISKPLLRENLINSLERVLVPQT